MMTTINKLRFRESLDKIENKYLMDNQISQQPLIDITTLMLRMKMDQIKRLERDIGSYNNPHFTKEYRILEGQCSKLQTDLDTLDVTGREELRKERKEALMLVSKLAAELGDKTHSDGQSCAECEI